MDLTQIVDTESQLRPMQKSSSHGYSLNHDKMAPRQFTPISGLDANNGPLFLSSYVYNDRSSKLDKVNGYTFQQFVQDDDPNPIEPANIRYGVATRLSKYTQ